VITAKVVRRERDSDEVLIGGDPINPTWEEYLNGFNENFRPFLIAIRKTIEDEGLVGTLASNFCNDHVFELSDGRTVSFSWRGWGDLMQSIVGKREGYMRYYM
jgi:poly-D-alanine transfer protein DltD